MKSRFDQTMNKILLIGLLLMSSGITASEVPALVKQRLNQTVDGYQATHIKQAPMPGWFQGQVGPRLFYISSDGRFLMEGHLFDWTTQQNLTAEALKQYRRGVIEGIDESSMITFKAPEERYVISVFTDIDCGYCRKLHANMGQYHKRGISVRYLAFPRAGIGSASYREMVSAWCADDPAAALTDAKQGQQIDALDCDSPVASHYQIGHDLGVNGTPALLLESGRMVPGFVDAPRLLELLEKE